jgi:hypothetical protein
MIINRRNFLTALAATPLLAYCSEKKKAKYPAAAISDFCKRLQPVGRILQMEEWYVWGTSPIDGPEGKVHIFFSRWPANYRMSGWIHQSQIAHAVADRPEGPYEFVETVFAPRGEGFWDATTCHNPHIQKVDNKYCLFYIGNSNKKTNTKRIGLAIADSLYGPWKRPDKPLLEPGSEEAWDNHCTSNPAFVMHPNGQYWLYYKSWNSSDYYNSKHPTVRGNRKYGLAIADKLEGPYKKYENNPVIDYSYRGENRQVEDAYVYYENGKFKMISRDMGIFSHSVGLYHESEDGIHWSEPKIAFLEVDNYIKQPPKPKHLSKYGRFERPQLLMRNGKPAYLFLASQGGEYMNSTAFVFKIG